jgi:hypothetical protein
MFIRSLPESLRGVLDFENMAGRCDHFLRAFDSHCLVCGDIPVNNRGSLADRLLNFLKAVKKNDSLEIPAELRVTHARPPDGVVAVSELAGLPLGCQTEP